MVLNIFKINNKSMLQVNYPYEQINKNFKHFIANFVHLTNYYINFIKSLMQIKLMKLRVFKIVTKNTKTSI